MVMTCADRIEPSASLATDGLPMPRLDAASLLDAWEVSTAQPPMRRALILLAAAWPEIGSQGWATTSIGVRDARLLTLLESLFGQSVDVAVACPSCAEVLECSLCTEELRVTTAGTDVEMRTRALGYEVEGRLPTSADLLGVADLAPQSAYDAVLRRCIGRAEREGCRLESGGLPLEVVAAFVDAMASADPQADVQVAWECPACRHQWSTTFDVLSYLWDEIDDWARRLVRQVHALASVYGWSERDILAMSARRRRLYTEMVGA